LIKMEQVNEKKVLRAYLKSCGEIRIIKTQGLS
jgi:hypothetical protein